MKDLKGCIIQDQINGFQKGLRQATFFYKDLDASDSRFNVNKDVVDGQLIREAETIPEEEAGRMAVDEDVNAEEVVLVEGGDEKAA